MSRALRVYDNVNPDGHNDDNQSHALSMLQKIQKVVHYFRTRGITKYLLYLLTCAAIASGIATYYAITQSSSPFGPDPDAVMGLVLLDLILLLLISVIVSRKVIGLWIANKRGVSAGSRVQSRIILMFSLGATIPTIVIALFSALFFNFGIQSWFDQRVSTAIEESVAVAEAYLKEHEKHLLADTYAMAGDLSRSIHLAMTDKKLLNRMVQTQATIRSLSEAVVFWHDDEQPMSPFNFRILAQGKLSFALSFERPREEDIKLANNGERVIVQDPSGRNVRALVKLGNTDNTYLMVGRVIDNRIIEHMKNAQGGAQQYASMKARISELQIKFSIIFVMVALLLLFTALLIGVMFTNYLVSPIKKLIRATERIKHGELSTNISIEGPNNDEFVRLGNAFNDMTAQLERQRSALLEANHQIDRRRRFSEAVLSGVSAGVIALNKSQNVVSFNRSAPPVLHISQENISGNIKDCFPEVVSLLAEVDNSEHLGDVIKKEITIERDNKKIILNVRVSTAVHDNTIEGYVITFDDITNLISAQRSAAWRDVARRIAHEIKNPLTPIQLAAERLRRKYSDQITIEPENYTRYIDTITSNVSNIGNMVEEFVNFSRMPRPEFKKENLVSIISEVIFAEQCVNESVGFVYHKPVDDVWVLCDKNQINQALINLCKNAVESITNCSLKRGEGCIKITLRPEGKNCTIEIQDNGPGFPEELIDRLTEPYVTTRAKGTGLGLAIVKKIMEDHEVSINLDNNQEGAFVRLVFKTVEG